MPFDSELLRVKASCGGQAPLGTYD